MMHSLYIAIPTHRGDVDYGAAQGIAEAVGMLSHLGLVYGRTLIVDYLYGNCYISQARSHMTAMFLDTICEEMLFIDDDSVFKGEDVLKIAEHDCDVVGGSYRRKYDVPEILYATPYDKNKLDPATGLVEVERIATGFLKIKRHVLDDMIDAYPDLESTKCTMSGRPVYMLFDSGFIEPKIWTGEDFHFSKRWHDIGGKMYLDPTLKIGHAGRHVWEE